jgi:hypothetical protein
MENTRDAPAPSEFPQIIPGLVDLFEILLPKKYLTDILLLAINNNVRLGKA